MNTGFACPACRAPLVLSCTAATAVDLGAEDHVSPCPNPFCRADLPARRRDMALTYALVGTLRDTAEPTAGLGVEI